MNYAYIKFDVFTVVMIVIVVCTMTPCSLVHGYPAFIVACRPLLGGDREIGDCTAAVDRKRPANHRRMMFSARSARQQLNYNNEDMSFLRGPCRDVTSGTSLKLYCSQSKEKEVGVK
jgi:hypothetical protein